MASFLSAIGGFVAGLLSLEVPGLGVSMGTFILGGWLLCAVGKFVLGFFYGDGGGDD